MGEEKEIKRGRDGETAREEGGKREGRERKRGRAEGTRGRKRTGRGGEREEVKGEEGRGEGRKTGEDSYAPMAHIARVNEVFIGTSQKHKVVFGCQSRTVMVRDRDCTVRWRERFYEGRSAAVLSLCVCTRPHNS